MKLFTHGTVKDGKFVPENPEYFRNIFQNFEGKRITMTINRFKKPRSDEQSNYYWGVIVKMISEETGEEKDAVHESLKALFLTEVRYVRVNKRLVKFTKVKGTSALDTIEFNEYQEHCRKWAAEFLGINIPDPTQCVF